METKAGRILISSLILTRHVLWNYKLRGIEIKFLSIIFVLSPRPIKRKSKRSCEGFLRVKIAVKTREGSHGSMLTHFNLTRPTIYELTFFSSPPPLLFSSSLSLSLWLPPYPLKDRHIMRLNDRPESTLTRNRPPHEPDEKWILDSRRACTPPFSIAEEKAAWGGIDIPAVLLRPFPPKAGPLLHLALPLPVCTTHAAWRIANLDWTRARRRII